jgi:ABC-type sugar transport system permease subunit
MNTKELKNNIKKWAYISPALILIGFVFIYPIIRVIQYSFFRVVLGTERAGESDFVGLANYILIFKDDLFWASLKHNMILFVICVPVLVGLSIVFSVLLFKRLKGWKIYRTMIFTPYVLPIVVVGTAFGYMFMSRGIVNMIFDYLNLDFLELDWLGKGYLAFGVLVFMIVWKELGFGVILMLARLMSIDESLLEAGELDGCSNLQLLFYVIIPQMKEVITFYAILMTIVSFTWLFNYVFILTRGGPGRITYILELYIYTRGFIYHNRGLGSAVASILLFILIILIFVPALRNLFNRDKRREG